MGDDERGDEGGTAISRADLDELHNELEELREAMHELRTASSAGERSEARSDVREAEEDVEATARRAGVSRKSYEAAIAAAKRAEQKEQLAPIVREIWDEVRAAETDDDDEKPKPKPKRKPKPVTDAAGNGNGDDPAADTEPLAEHWSERALGEMLR